MWLDSGPRALLEKPRGHTVLPAATPSISQLLTLSLIKTLGRWEEEHKETEDSKGVRGGKDIVVYVCVENVYNLAMFIYLSRYLYLFHPHVCSTCPINVYR